MIEERSVILRGGNGTPGSASGWEVLESTEGAMGAIIGAPGTVGMGRVASLNEGETTNAKEGVAKGKSFSAIQYRMKGKLGYLGDSQRWS